MFVYDIVRREVPTVREHSPITAAVDSLVRSGLGSLPVLDGSGLLAGVVSEGDLLRFAVGTGHESPGTHPQPTPAVPTAYRLDASRHVVADAMTRTPVTATERQPVEELARLFVRLPWRTLPVVRQGRLVGVVTRTDVVEALLCEAEAVPPSSRAQNDRPELRLPLGRPRDRASRPSRAARRHRRPRRGRRVRPGRGGGASHTRPPARRGDLRRPVPRRVGHRRVPPGPVG